MFPNADPRLAGGTGYEYYAGQLKFAVDFDPTQRLVLGLEYNEAPRLAAIDSLIQGYGSAVVDASNFFTPQSRLFTTLTYEVKPRESWLSSGRLKLGYQRILDDRLRRSYSTRPSFPNFGSGVADAFFNSERNNSNLFGTQLTLESVAGRHTLTYGGEVYSDVIFSDTVRRFDTGSTAVRPSRYVSGSTFEQWGIFLQDYIRWSDQVSTVLGVRYSSVTARVPADGLRDSPAFTNNSSDFTYNLSNAFLIAPEINPRSTTSSTSAGAFAPPISVTCPRRGWRAISSTPPTRTCAPSRSSRSTRASSSAQAPSQANCSASGASTPTASSRCSPATRWGAWRSGARRTPRARLSAASNLAASGG
ncbi:TonB-dependent receptor [Gloeobacter morelensis MG652769]|uniref:TonB-dependent receptor n=1 Tax=Gloeobacter morelensis MG652769 TaxID=2781736 RepID=A0ABY3PSN4_9CYAN|nr:TonB-dependent receptor [Gloeobacter morelensis MG652769]